MISNAIERLLSPQSRISEVITSLLSAHAELVEHSLL